MHTVNDVPATPVAKRSRVSKSALLAGAALGLPLAVQADVKFVDLQQTISSDDSAGGLFSFDMNGDGVNDFLFTAGLSADTVTPLVAGNGYVGTDTNNPTPLTLAQVTPPSALAGQNFQFGEGVLQHTEFVGGPFNKLKQKGPWDKTGGFQYLGVEFKIGSDLHYGWINLSACTPDFSTTCSTATDPGVIQINGYAYDTNGVNQVPEPSLLPILALGAAGLAAFRARRKAA